MTATVEAYARAASVHHDFRGRFALRAGRWKLLHEKPGKPALYDLEADPAETTDLAADFPDVVTDLTATLTGIVLRGRSTPGPPQANDGPAWWSQLTWIPRPPAPAASDR